MSIYTKMDYMVPQYTKTDQAIYEYVKKFENSFIHESINDLVSHFGFSQAALTRYAKKLGFDGFTQFQYQLKLDSDNKNKNSTTPSLRSSVYGHLLEATENSITSKQLKVLCNKIMNAQYVYTTGFNLSRLPAEYLEMSLRISQSINISFLSTEKFSFVIKNSNQFVLLVYSSTTGSSLKEVMDKVYHSKTRPYICLITMNPKHPLKKFADQVIILPESTTQDFGNKAITETFAYLMFNDILIDYISKHSKSLSHQG